MANYLRLHARQENFDDTVKKERQFETLLGQKSAKIALEPPSVNPLSGLVAVRQSCILGLIIYNYYNNCT